MSNNEIRSIKFVELNVEFGPDNSISTSSRLKFYVQAHKYEIEKFQKAISAVILGIENPK